MYLKSIVSKRVKVRAKVGGRWGRMEKERERVREFYLLIHSPNEFIVRAGQDQSQEPFI